MVLSWYWIITMIFPKRCSKTIAMLHLTQYCINIMLPCENHSNTVELSYPKLLNNYHIHIILMKNTRNYHVYRKAVVFSGTPAVITLLRRTWMRQCQCGRNKRAKERTVSGSRITLLDQSDRFSSCRLADERWLPGLWLQFNDGQVNRDLHELSCNFQKIVFYN